MASRPEKERDQGYAPGEFLLGDEASALSAGNQVHEDRYVDEALVVRHEQEARRQGPVNPVLEIDGEARIAPEHQEYHRNRLGCVFEDHGLFSFRGAKCLEYEEDKLPPGEDAQQDNDDD